MEAPDSGAPRRSGHGPPGCTPYVRIDVTFPIDGLPTAERSMPIPDDPNAAGLDVTDVAKLVPGVRQ